MKQRSELCEEVQKMMPFRVRGIRDGLKFSFAPMQETDVQKRCAYVCAAVEEKIVLLADLLGENSVIEISGASLGEIDRLRLEQRLGEKLKREVCVRLCREKEKAADLSRTYVGTVRSGMLVQAQGDLTVIGDVHIGARLEAGGSIIVLGKLAGSAWAGQNGDASAFVCAWQLAPSEIRIADFYSQKPGAQYTAQPYPELAYVADDEIRLRKYNEQK